MSSVCREVAPDRKPSNVVTPETSQTATSTRLVSDEALRNMLATVSSEDVVHWSRPDIVLRELAPSNMPARLVTPLTSQPPRPVTVESAEQPENIFASVVLADTSKPCPSKLARLL